VTDALRWLDSLQGSGIRPGLTRIRALLRHLGHPERAYPSVIVAGTNGKGSTSATLASIFRVAGKRTGLYTSPHLVDIRERWQIDGASIEPELLRESIDKLRDASKAAGIVPTYFEALTLVAFIAFAAAQCDMVVLEVGMGGRLDATNVVKPIAAVITPIGFDHTEYLGNTLRKIAGEKAGVIHRGAVVLTSNDDRTVLDVLRRRAHRFGNPFIHVTEEHDTPLPGAFQRRNVALAVRTARELGIDERSIAEGVASTRWRGRLERFAFGHHDVWVDGCHNGHAIAAVAPYIDRTIPRPRLLVFGIMGDKDVDAVTRSFLPLFDSVITTEPYPPRSATAASLADKARALGLEAQAVPEPRDAFARALEMPQRSVFVGGSLYLAGAAIEFLDERRAEEQQ
jgi:dihydrofolate synthase / folylpolyglutamate synthase